MAQVIGKHCLLDLYEIDPALASNCAAIEQMLIHAAELAGATVLHTYLHQFGHHQGITGMLLLCESHISIHTWPEHRFAAVDLFMCGETKPELAGQYLQKALAANHWQWREEIRGTLPPSATLI